MCMSDCLYVHLHVCVHVYMSVMSVCDTVSV